MKTLLKFNQTWSNQIRLTNCKIFPRNLIRLRMILSANTQIHSIPHECRMIYLNPKIQLTRPSEWRVNQVKLTFRRWTRVHKAQINSLLRMPWAGWRAKMWNLQTRLSWKSWTSETLKQQQIKRVEMDSILWQVMSSGKERWLMEISTYKGCFKMLLKIRCL